MQSTSATHVVLQAPAPHTNGAQPDVEPGTHVPDPLQVAAVVCDPLVQDAAVHTVPATYLRHAPAPSHTPSVPHEAAP